MSAFPPIGELIPHTAPMSLLDELVGWEDGYARVRLVLRDHGPFVRDGRVDAMVTLEIMAQCVACCLGMEAHRVGDPVRVGMVVACRRMDLQRAALAAGDELVAEARRVRGNRSTSVFEAVVLDAEQGTIASATLTLVHGENLP